MKHRDPSIRTAGPSNGWRIVRSNPVPAGTTHRVHRVNKPVPFVSADPGPPSMLPGGLPPVPYRNPWNRAGLTGRGAREPFNSKESKGEYWATKAYLEGGDPDSKGRR